MQRSEPTLQRKLLAWLLGPLLGLLIIDTFVTYSTSLGFSNRAHDRSLEEIAREVTLHVRPGATGPSFEITPVAERILRVDQDDRIYYKVSSRDGVLVGGDGEIAPPAARLQSSQPVFYDDVLHGERVRVEAARMAIEY
jgi:two-component system sensor histidine kinase TctE